MKETGLYTVRDVCVLLGITRKTLFYYDHLDLVRPYQRQGTQSAKIYDEQGIARLRRIISYKAAGLTLKEIRACLDGEYPETDILKSAVLRMKDEKQKLERMIRNTEERLQNTG